jgi:hypothetical protein
VTACAAFTAAEQQPTSAEFASGCSSCAARAMAATRADLLPDYRGAMARLFGDKTKEAHEQVKHWLGVIRRHQGRAT